MDSVDLVGTPLDVPLTLGPSAAFGDPYATGRSAWVPVSGRQQIRRWPVRAADEGGTVKVALITEGTYPLHAGGVSAWCDQLVRGLPEVRFEVVALSGSGREPVAFTPPGNVAAVRRVGLWARVPRGKPFTGRTTERFVGAYAQMFESVLRGGPRAAEWFETSLRTLRELSRRGSLTGALRSQLAVDVLLDVWSRTPVPGAPADVDDDAGRRAGRHRPRRALPAPAAAAAPKAQLVHATANGPSMLVGLTAKWAAGTPVLLSEHGVYLRERLLAVRRDGYPRTVRTVLVRFFHRLCELGYRGADVVLPVSDFNGRWAVRGGAPADRVRTLHNGVDPGELPLLEDEPAVPTLVFAGRIDPLKDLDTLVRAFALVREQVPDARLRLFGGVPAGNEAYAAEIRQLVADLGLGGQRHVRGAGVAGVAGVRGRARRRAVQPVGGAAADGHRGRDLRPPDRGDRRRRDARGGGPRRGGRAARRPGRLRGGVRRAC